MMMKHYETPELYLIQLSLRETILASVPEPTGNEMPILGRRAMEQELNGGGGMDAEDATEPLI